MNILLEALFQNLLEGYKEAQYEFAAASDPTTASNTIAMYKDLVNRNQFLGNERNIDWWRKQTWEKFSKTVSIKSRQMTTTREKRSRSTGNSIILDETLEWLIVIPLDKDASCFHGKHTDWCTAKPYTNSFETYFHGNMTLVYCLQLQTGKKWAIVVYDGNAHQPVFVNDRDNVISVESFKTDTRLDPTKYIQLVGDELITQPVQVRRSSHTALTQEVKRLLMGVDSPNLELEQKLLALNNLNIMLDYCIRVGKRWDRFERYLVASPIDTFRIATEYASNVVQGRWLEFERSLLKSIPRMTGDDELEPLWHYAKHCVTDNEWLELEAVLRTKLDASTGTEFNTYALVLLEYKGQFELVDISSFIPVLVARINDTYGSDLVRVLTEYHVTDIGSKLSAHLLPFAKHDDVARIVGEYEHVSGFVEQSVSVFNDAFSKHSIDAIASAVKFATIVDYGRWSDLEYWMVAQYAANISGGRPALFQLSRLLFVYINQNQISEWPQLTAVLEPTMLRQLIDLCLKSGQKLLIIDQYLSSRLSAVDPDSDIVELSHVYLRQPK